MSAFNKNCLFWQSIFTEKADQRENIGLRLVSILWSTRSRSRFGFCLDPLSSSSSSTYSKSEVGVTSLDDGAFQNRRNSLSSKTILIDFHRIHRLLTILFLSFDGENSKFYDG